jgi:uncharacterized protein YbjT (DUF2867 family)
MDREINRVTVFGGTGFVGRRIARHLRGSGATVRVASRHPRQVEGDSLEQIVANAHDERSVEAAARQLRRERQHGTLNHRQVALAMC